MPTIRTRYGSDLGLILHIALALGLVGAFYVLLGYPLLRLGLPVWLVLFLGACALVAQYVIGRHLTFARLEDSLRPPNSQETRVVDAFARVCMSAGVTTPRLMIADNPSPNALAIGGIGKAGIVVVPTGLLDAGLTGEELEAVLAHEVVHLMHRDSAVISVAGAFGALSRQLLHWTDAASNQSDEARKEAYRHWAFDSPEPWSLRAVAWFWVAFAGFAAAVLAFPLGVLNALLVGNLCRYRELAADRGAAVITGKPSSVAAALVKLRQSSTGYGACDLRELAGASTHLFSAPASTPESGDSRLTCRGNPSHTWYRPQPTHPKNRARPARATGIYADGGGWAPTGPRCPVCGAGSEIASPLDLLGYLALILVVAMALMAAGFVLALFVGAAALALRVVSLALTLFAGGALALGLVYVWTRSAGDPLVRVGLVMATHPRLQKRVDALGRIEANVSGAGRS